MRFEHDSEADAVYVYLSAKEYAYGQDLDDQRRVDYAVDGTPVGVELLNVSAGVSLTGLPRATELATLLDRKGIRGCLIDEAFSEESTTLSLNCGGRPYASINWPAEARRLGRQRFSQSASEHPAAKIVIPKEAITV